MTAFEYPAANTSWAPAAALAGALGVLRLCLTNTDKQVTKKTPLIRVNFLLFAEEKVSTINRTNLHNNYYVTFQA